MIINTGKGINYHAVIYFTPAVLDVGVLKNNTLTVAFVVIYLKIKIIYIVMSMTLLVVIRGVAFGK
jgi:hypothetical protein